MAKGGLAAQEVVVKESSFFETGISAEDFDTGIM